ncbi:MAG: lamin tail domain-containing protein [Bacteroidales bacterium]|nr:lamin tail domain-containing protein [Bacteroidales bacterium]
MLKRLIIVCLFLPVTLIAQITDDFEDGNISDWTESNVGRWSASDITPLNGSYSLHHVFDNTIAENDQISKSLSSLDLTAQNTVWQFKIQYDYNPSDGNNWTVFLVSDVDANQMVPGGTVNAYALGVNFSGSDDILKLLKITSGLETEIITTSLNWDDGTNPSDIVALEVTRSKDGNWEVLYSTDGIFDNVTSIGTGTDIAYTTADYFGIYYTYTSSADRKIWMDDIYIGAEIVDIESPKITNVNIIDAKTINVEYSEEIDSLVAVNISNYFIDKGVGNPLSVKTNETKTQVDLSLAGDLVNGTYYSIDIQNIEDQNSNIISDTIVQFLYYTPETYDVVINEIMADPTPEVGLPNYEFIEIKNTTEFDIDLSDWKLKVGGSEKDFPNYVLTSDSYVTLCSETAGEFLDDFGSVLEFSSFSSLTNSGTSIVIFDQNNLVIDSISFTDDWYGNTEKENGGWTIERIDPLNTCSTVSNWIASIDPQGGTPGTQNSVFASNIDNQAPEVEFIEIVSSNQIKLIFNESVTELTLLEKTNYSVNNGIGNPASVISNQNFTELNIVFLNQFPSKENLILSINNLSDECGNVIGTINLDFLYYAVNPYDIVINEIFADPEPSIELPEFEYIEIYNASEFEIDLSNWKLLIGELEETLPFEKINANEYIIICDEDAESALEVFGKVISVSSLPAIPNTEGNIVLRDKSEQIISRVSYNNSWYQDEYKSEGGWSLEQIDPMNPCGGENNWIASESNLGGTPGQINSVNANNPDLDSPELKRITVIDSVSIQLYFSESIDSLSAMNSNIYNVDAGIGDPISIDLIGTDYTSLILGFENEFAKNTIFTLEITNGIFDCSGNEINNNTAQFAIPADVKKNNLVINEVLFNPLTDGFDFVEIYNKSENTIDLKDVFISSYDYDAGEYKTVQQISTEGFLIFPKEYVVVTENPEIVQEHYYTNNEKGFLKIADLPSFSDDAGRVILFDKIQTIIDDFEYNEDMQYPLLATNEGVSLERINFDRPTNDKTNWHSASEISGFATPAYENSQFLESENIKELIQIEPEVFSPDNDGFEDFANINFLLEEPGYVVNIKIFDSKGRLVRYLSNNQLLGINGVISWDGLDEKNQKAPVGIYAVFIELFDIKGNVKQYKETVVVAAKY